MKLSDYVNHDATGLAELVGKGEVTAAELADCANAAIDALNPVLNFVAQRIEAPVMGDAGGPLEGVPFLCKDLVLQIKGVPHRAGTRMLGHGMFVPPDSTELFKRFQTLGVQTLAVTTTPEFGLNGATEALVYGGATRNPWDTSRSPGGSSGGSCAAIAAGVVPIAHGNDGGGSIRIPAASCGILGLKPTRGRTPVGPGHNLPLMGLGVEFAMSRSVRDSALMLDHAQGQEVGAFFQIAPPADPYAQVIRQPTRRLKIALALSLPGTAEPDPEQRDAVLATARLMEDMGHEIVEARPEFDGDMWRATNLTYWKGFTAAGVAGLEQALGITASNEVLEACTLAMATAGRTLSALDYEAALVQMNMICRAVGQFMESCDAFLLPTLRHLPVPIGLMDQNDASLDADGWHSKIFDLMPYCALFNMTGNPAISIPAGLAASDSGELPVAAQFVGRYGDEATLLQIARDIEQARPWAHLRPPVFAA